MGRTAILPNCCKKWFSDFSFRLRVQLLLTTRLFSHVACIYLGHWLCALSDINTIRDAILHRSSGTVSNKLSKTFESQQ